MKDEQKLQLNNLIELLGGMERYHKANIETGLSVFDSNSYKLVFAKQNEPIKNLSDYFLSELQNIQKALKLAKNIRDCPGSVKGDWQHK